MPPGKNPFAVKINNNNNNNNNNMYMYIRAGMFCNAEARRDVMIGIVCCRD
jgi:hypothetical protein